MEKYTLEQVIWFEKYRPTKLDDCILPDNLKTTFKQIRDSGVIPNMILSGTPGIGKTTVAKALCNELGCDWMLINGSDENGIDVLRGKIKQYASAMSLSGARKVIIIDEADYLIAHTLQPALRAAIEEFAINCSFILTCNNKHRIIDPIHSRCSVIDFTIPNAEKPKIAGMLLKRIQYILDQEKVTYDNQVLIQVITKFFPDFRRIINELQRYAAAGAGSVDSGILALVTDASINELVKAMREKDFGKVRKWVAINSDSADTSVLGRKLYDQMATYLEPKSIPQAILIISEYMYRSSFVADAEVNSTAMLAQLMIDCQFVR